MTSLFARCLGPDFDRLPAALRHLHGGAGRWSGPVTLVHGAGLAARWAARGAGYPRTAQTLTLTITPQDDGEIWHRDFDGHIVQSTLRPAGPGLIAELLWPATIILAPKVQGDGHSTALHIPIRRAALGPIPLPLSGGGLERTEGDAVTFDVDGSAAGLGRMIRYHGHLRPE